MAKPIRLLWMNSTLTPPAGQESIVDALPCHRDGGTVLSAWTLTQEELEAVLQTRTVLVHIMGETHAPLAVGVLAPQKPAETLDVTPP